jgi:hypothetical protein
MRYKILNYSVICFFTIITIFSCVSEDNFQKHSTLESLAINEVSKIKGIPTNNLIVATRYIKGFEVPIVTSNVNDIIYPVLINDLGIVKAVLEQRMVKNENGSISYYHFANGIEIGSNTVLEDKFTEFMGVPIEENYRILNDCEQAEGESCAGCHYRQMMEIIESDGETKALCDALGPECVAAVYVASAIHCWLKH